MKKIVTWLKGVVSLLALSRFLRETLSEIK
jgi:hypothetical protein